MRVREGSVRGLRASPGGDAVAGFRRGANRQVGRPLGWNRATRARAGRHGDGEVRDRGVTLPRMVESITARQFHEAAGVDDWRVLFAGASAHFRTGSFATGVKLVDAIGALADAANHHPDVDLRYPGVTVRLTTHEVDGLSERDVELARQISAAARELDVPADPTALKSVQVGIDALVGSRVMPFWRALLGYRTASEVDLVDPGGSEPPFWFQTMDAPRTERNRLHIDVSVPHDQAEERIAAAITAGGRLISDAHAPAWWTLADPEGNEADVATWMGRD